MKPTTSILTFALGLILLAPASMAQSTPGGTVITNQATATYSDGTNSFSTVSNTVTTTVSDVAGISITPDAGSNPTVVASQTGELFQFTLTNTGNISDSFLFLASGASIRTVTTGTTTVTVTRAVIDVDGSSTINAGDTDILGNAVDVTSAPVSQGGTLDVLVELTINAAASAGDTIQVLLGDDSSQAANLSANEVRTVDATTVNGRQEDIGDITATVQSDAQLLITATVPAGPVALGSTLAYSLSLNNPGDRDATGQSFDVDGGPQTGILVANPIPLGTLLLAAPAPTAPAGYVVVYTTSPLATAPSAATWTTAAPPPASVTRIGFFEAGGTLAMGSTDTPFTFSVIITTTDASNPIGTIAEAFAVNFAGADITDQSGDAVAGVGDLNADFTEGVAPGNADGDGIVEYTTLVQVGSVQLGPSGNPSATHTTDDDDFTELNSSVGDGVPPGGVTTAADTLVYVNTLQNTGNADDTFRITAPVVPAGFTVTVDPDGAGALPATTVSGGGFVDVPLAFGNSQDLTVSVSAPVGITVLTPYSSTLQAESQNSAGTTNQTVDTLFAGFIRLDKTVTITNGTGVGGANDPVPGAEVRYDVDYNNMATATAGAGNGLLSASILIINEDGNAAPNNWATYTDHVSATATLGTVADNAPANTAFTNNIATLGPGQSGTFTIRRTLK